MDGKVHEMARTNEVERAKPAKRVVIVENLNDLPPAEPGVVYLSKSQWKKFQKRNQSMEHVYVVVCRWCWLDGHGPHRAEAATGTLAKNKESGMYEHQGYCLGKQNRDEAARELRKP